MFIVRQLRVQCTYLLELQNGLYNALHNNI